jgi:hypothetical protein
MDSLEITKPAPLPSAPVPEAAPTPIMASCCSTASFPPDVVRSWIGNRYVLAIGGLAIGGTGLALGWNWLTAIGVAPLILSAGPCLLMCALGLCMMGRGHQASAGQQTPEAGGTTARTDPPAS